MEPTSFQNLANHVILFLFVLLFLEIQTGHTLIGSNPIELQFFSSLYKGVVIGKRFSNHPGSIQL